MAVSSERIRDQGAGCAADTPYLRHDGLHAGMNHGYLSRQIGHRKAKMFFEVYWQWIDGAVHRRETDKVR
jgi:hypothetical protein